MAAPFLAHATTDESRAGGGRVGAPSVAADAAAGHMWRKAQSGSVAGARPRVCTAAVQVRIRTGGAGVGAGAGRVARELGVRWPRYSAGHGQHTAPGARATHQSSTRQSHRAWRARRAVTSGPAASPWLAA